MYLTADERRRIVTPPDLPAALRRLLIQIPAGQVVSFGDLAEALGDLKAARWVATELQELYPDEFPIHRVIRRTGMVVESRRLSLADRISRLRSEGVVVEDDAVKQYPREFVWRSTSQPLADLQTLQMRLAELVTQTPLDTLPEHIAGVDVSYAADNRAVAAYTIVDTASGDLLHHELLTAEVTFPYIPGYLAFRELPLYDRLLDRVRAAGRLEPWLLVDGNGILHPRRAGIATMLGCLADVRTVGVSKHLLCGKVGTATDSRAEVRAADGSLLGYRLQRTSKRSTLYISPGTGIDVTGALKLTESQLRGRRLPEPIFHADRLSRQTARRL